MRDSSKATSGSEMLFQWQDNFFSSPMTTLVSSGLMTALERSEIWRQEDVLSLIEKDNAQVRRVTSNRWFASGVSLISAVIISTANIFGTPLDETLNSTNRGQPHGVLRAKFQRPVFGPPKSCRRGKWGDSGSQRV